MYYLCSMQNYASPKYKFMKKILLLTILLFILSSCEKVDNSTQFTINYSVIYSITEDIPTDIPIIMNAMPIHYSDDDLIENKTSMALINSVKLKKITLEIVNSEKSDFYFLQNIELNIKADGLPKIRVGWKSDIQNEDSNLILLEILDDDIQEYFKKKSFDIQPIIILEETLEQTVDINISIDFEINADLLEN